MTNRRNFLKCLPVMPCAAVPVVAVADEDPHMGWLKEWRYMRECWQAEFNKCDGNTQLSIAHWSRAEELSKLLGGTVANSTKGLLAQTEWFLEEFGLGVISKAPQTILAGIERVA